MLIEKVDILEISRVRSLDTTQNPVVVLGSSSEEYIRNLETIIETLNKEHTLARRDINLYRQNIVETDFFINSDGTYGDRQLIIERLLMAFRSFGLRTQRLHATIGKSRTQSHNLKLSEVIISDMISFVSSLRYVNNRQFSRD